MKVVPSLGHLCRKCRPVWRCQCCPIHATRGTAFQVLVGMSATAPQRKLFDARVVGCQRGGFFQGAPSMHTSRVAKKASATVALTGW